MKEYLVDHFYQKNKEELSLEMIAGYQGLKRRIRVPEAHRPGLALTGYLKSYAKKRILVLGKVEIDYLKQLDADERKQRLDGVLTKSSPAVIITRRYRPPKDLKTICNERQIPLFRSNLITMHLLNRLVFLLEEEFSPEVQIHGTLVEVFGLGLLIQGNSSVGKSEAALGLIERGHRLIADDVVVVKRVRGSSLEGSCKELGKHILEIRGIGIINVAHIYGAVCVRDNKSIDLIVELEAWSEQHFYDRVGNEYQTTDILNVPIPLHTLPVKPGRDVVLLLETIALNHRLKQMGYHSAKEFSERLRKEIQKRQNRNKPGSHLAFEL